MAQFLVNGRRLININMISEMSIDTNSAGYDLVISGPGIDKNWSLCHFTNSQQAEMVFSALVREIQRGEVNVPIIHFQSLVKELDDTRSR